MGKTKKKKKTISNTVAIDKIISPSVAPFDEIFPQPNTYELLIKEFSFLSKSNLVLGTNAVLRLLEQRGSLVAVFLFSKRASPPVYHSLSFWCRSTDVEFITLQEKDKSSLGPKFPKAITYGIQKETIQTLPHFASLLDKLKTFRKPKKQEVQECPAIPIHAEKIIFPSNKTDSTYYHKKHNAIPIWDDQFISLSQYSERNIDFPIYDINHQTIDVSIK